MVKNEQSNDNTRRTFLQLLGVTGAATAGLGSLSTNAAAETSSTTAMNTTDLNADDLVPANKFLSLSFPEVATDEIETLDVLVDEVSVSKAQMYQTDDGGSSAVVSVFDMVTNHDLEPGQTLPVEVEGKTVSGESFTASDSITVIDPTDVLGNRQNGDDGTGSDVDDAATEVTDTVDSSGILGKPSSQTRRQQMY